MANNEQILLTQKAYQELTKGRVNWLVDEAETMLNLASQQLLLSGNVQGAAAVLEHIDGRLSRFDQPELLSIKQAVSHDLAALKNRPLFPVCRWCWTAYCSLASRRKATTHRQALGGKTLGTNLWLR